MTITDDELKAQAERYAATDAASRGPRHAGISDDELCKALRHRAGLPETCATDAYVMLQAEQRIKLALRQSSPPDGQTAGDGWRATRDTKQQRVAEWCAAAFGADHQSSVPQRGLRMLEEAIEAYQATSGSPEVAHKLVDYIFAKEPGELFQELGGLGVTTLALAAAAGVSADKAELTEIERVLSKPLEHFWARNKVKNDAGFDATAYPTKAQGE